VANDTFQPPESISKMQRLGMGAALVGVVLTILVFAMSGQTRFFQAYLVAYTWGFGIVLGSMALLMVQHLTGGAWGVVIRRPLEAAVRTMPIMTLLFVPILFGIHDLYHWSHEEVVAGDAMLEWKQPYLNTTFFIARQVVFFVIWNVMAWFLTSWSAEQDRAGSPDLVRKFSILSGAGLVIYSLTLTFAMVDWTMSVNPHWFSTMWGPLHMVGQGLSAFAFSVVVLIGLAHSRPLNTVVTPHHTHDLGKYLFAFLMLHAYLSFSQFLIIWSANLAEEIPHYLVRWDQGFQYVSLFIIIGHFAIPYTLLLSRNIKRNFSQLRLVAIWILFARVVDYFWHVAPEFHPDGLNIGILFENLATTLAVGGVFLALFAANLRKYSLMPVHDPGLPKALAHHVH
jgi:hypothetical protein